MAYGNSTSPSKSTSKSKPVKNYDFDTAKLTQTGMTPPANNITAPQTNAEQIILNREVFNKVAFNNTINTSFTQLDQAPKDLSFFDSNLATVNDFFNIYQNLFFQIPKYGPTNSHEYLVVESTAYTGFIENQEQIDALLEEIADLREENLQLQLDIGELLGVKATLDQAIRQTGEAGSLEELLQQEANLGAEQSNSSSDNPPPPPPNTGTGGIGSGGGGGNSGGNNQLIDASLQNENPGGPPVPGRPGSNINPGNLVY
tara:strand:- start:588 stop:1361 length:774 start_codon:yes stop_codon:yes gene_type:complete